MHSASQARRDALRASYPSVIELASAPAPALAADTARLRGLYEEHAPFVRQLVARLAGLRADVDDLTHEVFLVAWRKLDRLAPGTPERAWLYAIAVRVASHARRRAKVRRFLGLEAAERVASERTPASEFARREASEIVYRALEPLAEKKRAVFVLYELQGMTGEEIAQVVGCPLKTVWTRLYHARREFSAELERHAARETAATPGGSLS